MRPLTVAGIDPGATTAIVWLELRGTTLTGARVTDVAILHPSRSVKLSAAEQKATLFDRVRDAFVSRPVALVALEEPMDAGKVWANATRRVRGQQGRTTHFLLGEHYGLALAAVRAACPAAALAAYPVNDYGGRPGWMQAGARRPQSRDATMVRLAMLARSLGMSAESQASEDALMALGVVLFHVSTPPIACAG